jgi:citrate synthase
MGNEQIDTELTGYDEESITLRGTDFTDDIVGELSFPATVYYLWTGTEPTESQEQVVDAMLTGLVVHGTTPSAIASRMVARNEPKALQAAVAGGLLGVGSGYLGTQQRCAKELQALAGQSDVLAAVEELVSSYLDGDEQFPGIGHPVFTVDPRAERLFEIAAEEGIAGTHVEILWSVHGKFEAEIGSSLTINVIGAMAAIGSDAGLSPEAIRSLAIVSSAAGLTGAVLEERDQPIADDIWQLVERERHGQGGE